MKKSGLKIYLYVITGLLLLFLFHFESLSLGPVKISHLWKGMLLLFLIIKILSKKRNNLLIYKPLIWLALFQLINIELFNNTFNAFLIFGTTLILPLLGIYTLQFTSKQISNGLLFFSSFFILSFIPYEIGLLKSIDEGYTLTSYGVESYGSIGPFQTPHLASSALAGSFIVILYFWLINKYNRFYLTTLLVLGFYFLVFTYVRTGLAMVIIGVLPLLYYFTVRYRKSRIQVLFAISLISVLSIGWVLSNETLMNRITGKRATGTIETNSIESLGSGRGGIYLDAIEIFLEANIIEKIIGVGQTAQKDRMEQKRGVRLFPHNGFLLILLNNGIVGFLFFIVFIKKIMKHIHKTKSFHKPLIKGVFFAYLVMTFVQNYDMLYMCFLLFLSITYTYKHLQILPNKNFKYNFSIK